MPQENTRRAPLSETWPAWALAITLWRTRPFLDLNFLFLTEQLDWYPINADSIAIPMLGSLMLGVLGLPFWIIYCFKTLRRLPPGRRMFRWAPKLWAMDRLRSGIFTICIVWCCIGTYSSCKFYFELLASSYSKVSYLGIVEIAGSIGWILLWLVFLNCVREFPDKPASELEPSEPPHSN